MHTTCDSARKRRTGRVWIASACSAFAVGCALLEPCSSALESTWRVSPDYAGESEWCRGLCDHADKSFDKVIRSDVPGGVLLSCYCCK